MQYHKKDPADKLDPRRWKAKLATEPGSPVDIINAIFNEANRARITNSEIARRTGISRVAISRYKSGLAVPSIGFAEALAEAVGKRIVLE